MLNSGIQYRFVIFIFSVLLIGVGFTEKTYAEFESAEPGLSELESTEFESLSERQRTLVIGKISSNPKKHYPRLKPMVDYAASMMKDLGINQTRVLLAKDTEQMLLYLKEGSIDWVTETPLIATVLEDKANMELLLLKWKKGVPEYHTVIFVRRDSGINSLNDLPGKTVVFQDKGSTSAYLVPAAMLLDQGLQLLELASVRSTSPTDKVGYVFTREEVNMSTWVYKKIVAAGAFSDLDWNSHEKVPDIFKEELKILSHSQSFPRVLELVREKMSPDIKHRLKEVLLNAHKDPDAKAALKAYQKTSQFAEIDDNIRTGLEEIRRMKLLVNSTLN